MSGRHRGEGKHRKPKCTCKTKRRTKWLQKYPIDSHLKDCPAWEDSK